MTTATLSRPLPAVDRPSGELPELPKLPELWWRGVLVVAAAFVALEMVLSARYGFHRDELYFLACARHLAWGYVDQPPLVPAVAWLAVHVLGTSPTALRTLPALAGGGAVVVTAFMARELGGGRKAQLLAALAAATSPEVLAAFHLLSTASFDLFFWSVLTFLLLRILRTGNDRLWVVLGVVAGVGLMNKFNVAFLLASVAAGLLLTGRARALASPWLWAGAGIALIIWLPNIVWNAQHDWAAVSMLRSLHQENGGLGASLEFVPAQLIVVGPVLVVLWIAGLLRLLASPFARALGVAYLILLVVFAPTGAKPYYLGGLYYVLFAAGGVWAEERLNRAHPARGVTGWVVLLAMGCLFALPLSVPVLPQSALAAGSWEGTINKDLSATVGWHDFVGELARVSGALPPRERATLVIFTGDYGAAGAVDLWGPAYGLPHAISGHNNYWWWGPSGAHNGATTIAVDIPKGYLLTIFREVTPAGTVTTPGGVWSEERGDPIWICRGQRVSWQAAWPSARHYG